MEGFDFEKTIESIKSKKLKFVERTIPFHHGKIKIFYIQQLTDRMALSETVIKPLVLYCSANKKTVDAQKALDEIIYADDCKVESDTSKIQETILSGMVVILFSTDERYIVANFKKVQHRSVPQPEINYTVRGPQDCFTENLDVNLSLIRYRVKDKNICIKDKQVGERTKTRVAIIYLQDIAREQVVREIEEKIDQIIIDGIGESGELQAFLSKNGHQLFPSIGLVERSDMAFNTLIEGKVLILVEGSGIALVAPKTFSEFFYSCDDRYEGKFFGLFARIIRYFALILAFTGSSLFVAITSFNTEVLPTNYVISLAEMRVSVPFPAIVGALILECIAELLREALLRVPKQIGPAIGIVGAIVIGQAAISAGVFSPLLLIIVSASLLASFTIPDFSLMNAFRVLKFILLLFTGMFGFFGFSLFITFVLIELVSMESFGVPFMAPWAPFNFYDFVRSFIFNSTSDPLRPKYLRTKDKTRTKIHETKRPE